MPHPEFALKSTDWLVFFSYFLMVAMVAYGFGRKQHSAVSEYFMAGNSLPWFVVAGSMIIMTLSTEQIIGNNGAAYQYGFSIAQWDCWTLPWVTLLVWVFLPVYLRRRVRTIPDFLAQRYGEGLRDIFSVISILSFTFLNMAVILYTGVILLSNLFPVKLVVAGNDYTHLFWCGVLVISTLIYTTWGGLATVAWTDFMQFFVVYLGGGLIVFFALRAVGGGAGVEAAGRGWAIIRQAEADRFHLFEPADHPLVPWPALFMRVVTTQLYFNCATQFILQRALAAKSDWDARIGSLIFGSFGMLAVMISVLPGLIAFHLNPHLDPNNAVSYLIRTVIPSGWGARGLILAGLTAAIMSALSSLISSTTTVFVLDIYKKWIHPAASDHNQLTMGRVACVAFMGLAVIWTPMVGKYRLIFVYLQSFLAYIAAPAGAIFLLGVFWPRANQKAAISAISTGLPFCVAVEVYRETHPQFTLPAMHTPLASLSFIYISFVGWIISMVVIVAVSLASPSTATPPVEDLTWSWAAAREPQSAAKGGAFYRSLWFWYLVSAAVWVAYCAHFW